MRQSIIEELENDLHPGALRILLGLVERSADQGNQFVISTHSNVVVRHLGGRASTRIVRIERQPNAHPPLSRISEVPNDSVSRRTLLSSLGYDLLDYDLYSAWLILEEASAERLVREFIVPWFVPKLAGRLRTIAAQGASDLEARFSDLIRLFVFVHLEPIYLGRAWVIADGDAAGLEAVSSLRSKFRDWPEQHFLALGANNIEHYFPTPFGDKVAGVLAIKDRQARRVAKAALVEDVIAWLRVDEDRGRAELAKSAHEVILRLEAISAVVIGIL